MLITYSDGRAVEAVLLARSGEAMRVAMKGADDATEFRRINGTWVSDDCEPVRIEFEWERMEQRPPVSEADCYCSPERAAGLIRLLLTGGPVLGEDASPQLSAEAAGGPVMICPLRASAN